jgi:hypothetical protein
MRNTEIKWIYGTADQNVSFLTLGKGFLVDVRLPVISGSLSVRIYEFLKLF